MPENFGEVAKAVFDILSLAVILFFVYRFAVKRKAVKLALGVVLFLLVMLFVDATNLTALGFVFGDFRQLGVIAILIIFQPELRSALEKIGGTTFQGLQNMNLNHFGEKTTGVANSQQIIDAVAMSASRLSELRYGALIVIEREDSLAEYKASGTVLDAVVNANTLNSIFYKGTALHDGAVVIHNGRIESAGCVLPMTSRVDLEQELGTRHRAAIGTTEGFDAVVVIVSEETGLISIALNGDLERGFTNATLRVRLSEILSPANDQDGSEKKKLRRRFFSRKRAPKNDGGNVDAKDADNNFNGGNDGSKE